MINSVVVRHTQTPTSEKLEIDKKIDTFKEDLTDLFDVYASANEDLFNMVDTELMKLHYKVMRFKIE